MSSLFLAQLIGLFLTIMGITLFWRADHYKGLLKDFQKSKGLMFLASISMLVVGLLMVLSHNIWNTIEQSFVSLIGWAVLLKAILWLLFPKQMLALGKDWDHPAYYRVCALVWMTLGVYLLGYVYGYFV